jgi:hypothetical protein
MNIFLNFQEGFFTVNNCGALRNNVNCFKVGCLKHVFKTNPVLSLLFSTCLFLFFMLREKLKFLFKNAQFGPYFQLHNKMSCKFLIML